MTPQDLVLVAGMASLAVVITLADLIASLIGHRRKLASGAQAAEDKAALAKREEIRRRLAAIQAAQATGEKPPTGKPNLA